MFGFFIFLFLENPIWNAEKRICRIWQRGLKKVLFPFFSALIWDTKPFVEQLQWRVTLSRHHCKHFMHLFLRSSSFYINHHDTIDAFGSRQQLTLMTSIVSNESNLRWRFHWLLTALLLPCQQLTLAESSYNDLYKIETRFSNNKAKFINVFKLRKPKFSSVETSTHRLRNRMTDPS